MIASQILNKRLNQWNNLLKIIGLLLKNHLAKTVKNTIRPSKTEWTGLPKCLKTLAPKRAIVIALEIVWGSQEKTQWKEPIKQVGRIAFWCPQTLYASNTQRKPRTRSLSMRSNSWTMKKCSLAKTKPMDGKWETLTF